MQKLNIAILSYRSAQFGGGQGVYVRDISYALYLMGHNVDVISGPPYPNLHPEINLIRLPGLNLFETFSFFVVPGDEAEVVIEIFRRKKRGKRSIVERAKGKDSGKKNNKQ